MLVSVRFILFFYGELSHIEKSKSHLFHVGTEFLHTKFLFFVINFDLVCLGISPWSIFTEKMIVGMGITSDNYFFFSQKRSQEM